ncbi:MAG: DUF444 family protein [Bacteriovoracaceae bacterium]|nr:DUF444 family protein [Bacteriovoracaceae bacterium]
MDHPIKRDHSRFRKIVKGKIRDNLRKYVSAGEMPVPKGDGTFKIPMPSINTPRFKFGEKQQGGQGQGDGKPGDPVDGQQGEGEPGQGEAGEGEGNKELEVDLSLDELASILGEELELPNIEPKGKKTLESTTNKYKSIGTVGPDSLKHFKRSYKEALKRQVSIGQYDPENPVIIPSKGDMRYRSSNTVVEFENSAVVIYMMDVSGSMGDEQKEIVRTESFWINLWLKSQYKNIEIRYIIHDATAKEVDEKTFFSTRESGGTLISSAFKLCREIISEDYNSAEWNIYPFHFSDGDNWSTDDTKLCLDILDNFIIPNSNVFCYGQVESRYGSGQFYKDLHSKYGDASEEIILSKVKNKDAILDSIKDFLGKGK